MRKSLVFILILIVLIAMPKEHADVPGLAAAPSPSTPDATPTPLPPVIFVGDSVTMGAYASTPQNTFVWHVHRYLETHGFEGDDYNIWTFSPRSDLLAAKRAAVPGRELIIVEVGVHWSDLDATQFKETYGAMLDCLAASGARVVVGTIPWLNWQPDTPSYLEMAFYSQLIRVEAAKRGIAVADLWAATDHRSDAVSRPGQSCYLIAPCQGDNYHPGDVGHELIAEAYERALDLALTAAPPRPVEGGCQVDAYLDALRAGLPVRLTP